jgi:hypothetical protein
MGLLTTQERYQLIDLLTHLPHSSDPGVRNQLLSALPHSLRTQIAFYPAPKSHFISMVNIVDEYSQEPYDGEWPLLLFMREACFQGIAQSPTGKQLSTLLYAVQMRIDQRMAWNDTFAHLEPQSTQQFERMVDSARGLHCPVDWRAKMRASELATCLIRYRGHAPEAQGTGFLVARDLIMTNYHVVYDVFEGRVPDKDVRFLFDYKTLEGSATDTVCSYTLAPNGCRTYSPQDKLDFALLRIQGNAGDEEIHGYGRRGWLQPKKHEFLSCEPLFILQHPDGGTLKFAFDAITRIQPTRIDYRTNTSNCSSGSPCFTLNWDLVALHQGYDKAAIEQTNHGIPFNALLERRDLQAMLAT